MREGLKRYYCDRCGCVVMMISPGSKIKKGVVVICKTCQNKTDTPGFMDDLFKGFRK